MLKVLLQKKYPKYFFPFLAIMMLLCIIIVGCDSDCSDDECSGDACSDTSDSSAGPKFVLEGKARVFDIIDGATLNIYDTNGKRIYKEDKATGNEGMFYAEIKNLPENFTIELTGGNHGDKSFKGKLLRNVKQFNTDKYYYVNGITTLKAAYMKRHPESSIEEVDAVINNFLNIPKGLTLEEVIKSSEFSSIFLSNYNLYKEFENKVQSLNFDEFIDSLVKEVEAGEVLDLSDPTVWEFDPILSDNLRSKLAVSAILKGVGGAVNGVMTILKLTGVIKDPQKEALKAIQTMKKDIADIKMGIADIKGRLLDIKQDITKLLWDNVNSDLKVIEAYIDDDLSLYDNILGYINQGNYTEAEKTLQKFNTSMSAPKLHNFSYKQMIDYYMDLVSEGLNETPAIQTYTDMVIAQNGLYTRIEDRFLQFLNYETAALKLMVVNQTNELTYESEGIDPKSADAAAQLQAKMDQKKDEIVRQFIEGSRYYEGGKQQFYAQLETFVPAIELFVVSNNNDSYYQKLAQCDNTGPKNSNCTEDERPLMRSQFITHFLLDQSGVLKSQGGIFIKLLQKKRSGAEGLANKSIDLALDNGTVYNPTRLNLKNIEGKQPDNSNRPATWEIATYQLDLMNTGRTFTIDTARENNNSLHPIYHSTLTLNTGPSSLLPNVNFGFFTGRTVPVRDFTFYNRSIGICPANNGTGNSQTITASGCPAQFMFRMYGVGPSDNDYVIGLPPLHDWNRQYFNLAKPYFIVTDTGTPAPYVFCGSQHELWAYDRNSKTPGIWNLDGDDGGPNLYGIGLRSGDRYMYVSGSSTLTHSNSGCLGSTTSLYVYYKGGWR
ncbi:MAG: hypothetical protein HQK77_13235 [Desulfobacterales bacterium]|nr:hypothetical protein [Desulfobacterales bacterium]